ncbi:hypothetical protein [Moraxella boevrei]|uniref:hypothetical protein n=1 Tax=Faucicola boevrei TaxID=346665 RepID=UPI0037370DF6
MLAVLSLVIVEKIINTAIASDPITQLNLQALTGKTLRIVIGEPRLKIDVLFNEKRIRFEPVLQKTAIFEPKFEPNAVENRTNNLPNATIFAKNFADLSQQFQQNSLSKYPNIYPNDINPNEKSENQFLAQVEQVLCQFEPDIVGKLQPIMGLPLASQLANIGGLGGFTDVFKTFSKSDNEVETFEPDELLSDVQKLQKTQQRLANLQQQLEQLQQQIQQEQQKLSQFT